MADRPPFARVALIGPPGAGKTTLFCALSGMEYARAVAGSGKVIAAALRVEDPRLVRIHEKEEPRSKRSCPTMEVVDTPAIALDGPDRDRNPGVLHQLREMTGLVVLLKAYDLDGTPEEKGRKLQSQMETIRSELLLNDAEALQRRVEKIDERLKRTLPTAERESLEEERSVLSKLVESISAGNPKVLESVPPEVEKALRAFALFSRKPLIPLVNLAENDLGQFDGFCLRLEHELLLLSAEERESYMKDYGMSSLSVTGFPVAWMSRLGFLMFLTVGPKETVGWPLRRGAPAPEAAGVIHTDLQKGFINVEVMSFADWERLGSLKEVARAGRERVEGKHYVLQDCDIINVKFAV